MHKNLLHLHKCRTERWKFSSTGTMPAANVIFQDPTGKELNPPATINLHDHQRLSVPDTATHIVVRYGSSVTNPYPLIKAADYPQYIIVTGLGGEKILNLSTA